MTVNQKIQKTPSKEIPLPPVKKFKLTTTPFSPPTKPDTYPKAQIQNPTSQVVV